MVISMEWEEGSYTVFLDKRFYDLTFRTCQCVILITFLIDGKKIILGGRGDIESLRIHSRLSSAECQRAENLHQPPGVLPPCSRPDAWEQEALEALTGGQRHRVAMTGMAAGPHQETLSVWVLEESIQLIDQSLLHSFIQQSLPECQLHTRHWPRDASPSLQAFKPVKGNTEGTIKCCVGCGRGQHGCRSPQEGLAADRRALHPPAIPSCTKSVQAQEHRWTRQTGPKPQGAYCCSEKGK